VHCYLIPGSLGPHESDFKTISIGSSVFAGLTDVANTDRPTIERAARVSMGRIDAMHVTRPDKYTDRDTKTRHE